jgi:quinol-cytochrome oxidoreductase complex cytochrome b subunit
MSLSPPIESDVYHGPQTGAERRSRMKDAANNLILHLHPTRVPAEALRFTFTWGLGGISAVLALMLALTGVMLMFRYEPTVERAYISIQLLESQVPFGSLFRAVHHWSANLLVVTATLHLVRVFLTGGFKGGRTLNWIIGLSLLALVLVFNFTGYLLPWDQLAYWAITVSTSLVAFIPAIGRSLSQLALGGPGVGQGALSNFYALHVAVLPVLTVVALTYHFWRVRKDGGLALPKREAGEPVHRVTTIPHLVRVEFAAAAVVLTAVIVFAMFVPAPLLELANPTHSPNPAKAAWYFVGLQELLLHMDTLAAMALVLIVGLGLVLLPRWDRAEENMGLYFRSRKGRKAAILGAILSVDLVPLLVAADEYWIDLPAAFPGAPTLVSNGLIPLLLTLGGLAAVYWITRRVFKADHSEGMVGLFSFVMMSLVVLTIIGQFFRGAGMALVLPF